MTGEWKDWKEGLEKDRLTGLALPSGPLARFPVGTWPPSSSATLDSYAFNPPFYYYTSLASPSFSDSEACKS